MLSFQLSDEQEQLRDVARQFTKAKIIPVAAKADHHGKFPKDVFDEAWKLGLVAPNIPEAYGGPGLHEIEHVLITEELAYGWHGLQTPTTVTTHDHTP